MLDIRNKMREKLLRFFGIEHKFKREFKNQVRMFIIITLGFTIAFSWRQTVFDLSQTFVQFITDVKDSSASTILTSTFITIFSIFIIYLASHFLKNEDY